MDLKQLKYFVTIVEEGNISAAARRLSISQPPLSYQMHTLEDELGTQLFTRGTRSIQLTESGELLYRQAKTMLNLEAETREELDGLKNGKQGSVRIGMISSCSSEVVYQTLQAFINEYPKVSVQIYEGNTYYLLDQIRKENLDMAIVRTPYQDREVEHINLQTDTLTAVGSAKWKAFLTQPKMKLSELEDVPLISYRRWSNVIEHVAQEEGCHLSHAFRTDDARTCLDLARNQLGVALVPDSILTSHQNLFVSRLSEIEFTSQLRLIRKKGRILSSQAESLYASFAK